MGADGLAHGDAVRIVVAVPTFRRNDAVLRAVRAVLAELGRMHGDPRTGVTASVLVVDNDAARSAEPGVLGLRSDLVRYVCEPVPGISAARNRALAEAEGADLLAFLDDDEVPREGWLEALVATWRRTGAAAVAGRVVSEFTAPLDPWIASGRFFERRNPPTGTPLELAATNNLLLDLRQVAELGVRFDPRLGLSGGEDNLFCRQLRARGGAIVWCGESLVADLVPADRTTRRWVLQRSWSHGNTGSLVRVLAARGVTGRLRARVIGAGRGVAALGIGSLRWLAGAVTRSRSHEARGARTLFRGAGMIAGALGVLYREYSRGR